MGAFASRPRDHNDDISRGGGDAAPAGAAAAAPAGLLRGRTSSFSPPPTSEKRSHGDGRTTPREKQRIDNPSLNSAAASSKEKRKTLALIKNLPPTSKSRSTNRNRGRAVQRGVVKTNMNWSDTRSSSKATAASVTCNRPPRSGKENDARVANQSRQGSSIRLSITGKGQVGLTKDQNESSSSTTFGKKKKLRATAPSYNLRRNGSKPPPSVNPNDAEVSNTNTAAIDGPTMKVPVDPPGAVLGALPWMHHGQQIVSSTEQTVDASGQVYGGGGQPMFQPMFPPMSNWGYQPSHNQQGQGNADHRWSVPPFLAPLAATVRHPFANFMTNNGHPDNTWASSGAAINHYAHVVHNAQQGLPVEERNAEMSSEADDAMSTDDSMASEDVQSQDFKEVKTEFIPSTFAPPEYVETIRARQEAVAAANVANTVQTRSMTAKKNLGRRSASSSSNDNAPLVRANTTAAHQACSPGVRGSKASGSKVAAVDAIVGCADSPSPQVMTILGKRVTMIDPVRKVFVIDLLSPEECDAIRMTADNYTREIYKSGSNAETWRTLYTYTKMDLPVVEVKDLVSTTDAIMLDVKKIVGEIFGMKKEAMKLRPRSWKEPHLLLYQALDGRDPHTGIEMHYDGCAITWQAMLTRLDEYEGGGTYFRCLRKTVKLQQGQVLVHPGELYHKGIDITYGVRCLLVCFTDGMDPKIMDDSKPEEDDKKYEKNVVICK